MKKLTVVVFLLLGTALFANGQDAKAPAASKYKVGQKWSYNARPGEEHSYLIIVKIDDDPKLGRIIHIALRDLKMKNPRSPDGITQNVNHMPFLEAAIEKSGLKLLKDKVDLPDFQEGYQAWREAFVAERAGAYSITVGEAVTVMETALNR